MVSDRLLYIYTVISREREMQTLTFNQSIYKLIKSKLITQEDGLLRATNPEALKMNLKGIFLDESRRIMSAA